LVKEEAILRRRAVYQALCMGAFNAFWTAIALRLEEVPFGLAAAGVALFALVGVASAVAAPIAGRLGDSGLTAPATRVSHAAIIVALIGAGIAGAGWFGFDANAGPRFALALLVSGRPDPIVVPIRQSGGCSDDRNHPIFMLHFCHGPRLVNPLSHDPVAGVLLLSGVGAWPPPDGVG
jgi:hypothetical protein